MNIANIGLLPTRDSIYRIFLGTVNFYSYYTLNLLFFSLLSSPHGPFTISISLIISNFMTTPIVLLVNLNLYGGHSSSRIRCFWHAVLTSLRPNFIFISYILYSKTLHFIKFTSLPSLGYSSSPSI